MGFWPGQAVSISFLSKQATSMCARRKIKYKWINWFEMSTVAVYKYLWILRFSQHTDHEPTSPIQGSVDNPDVIENFSCGLPSTFCLSSMQYSSVIVSPTFTLDTVTSSKEMMLLALLPVAVFRKRKRKSYKIVSTDLWQFKEYAAVNMNLGNLDILPMRLGCAQACFCRK